MSEAEFDRLKIQKDRLLCHCGKDGHAINSVNCPTHGSRVNEGYRNALLWAFDRLSVTGGMDSASQKRTMKEIGNVLTGRPSPAARYQPNDWDVSAKLSR